MNSEPPQFPKLAAFQAAMLEVLHAGGEPDAMRAHLLARISDPAMNAYVQQFDDRMLLVASELVRKWGRRAAG